MSEQNSNISSSERKFSILKAIKFIIVSYLVSLILVFSLASLVVYTDVPESVGNVGVEVIAFLGAFICAFLLGRNLKRSGLIGGGVIGTFSILGLMLIGVAVYGEIANVADAVLKISGGFLSGAVGGILGVNTGKE